MVVFRSNPEIRKLEKTETFVTMGDMTYVREVTETDFYNCMCLYFQAYFLSLFELVNLLSRQFYAFNAYILLLRTYSNAGAGAGYIFYPLSPRLMII